MYVQPMSRAISATSRSKDDHPLVMCNSLRTSGSKRSGSKMIITSMWCLTQRHSRSSTSSRTQRSCYSQNNRSRYATWLLYLTLRKKGTEYDKPPFHRGILPSQRSWPGSCQRKEHPPGTYQYAPCLVGATSPSSLACNSLCCPHVGTHHNRGVAATARLDY